MKDNKILALLCQRFSIRKLSNFLIGGLQNKP